MAYQKNIIVITFMAAIQSGVSVAQSVNSAYSKIDFPCNQSCINAARPTVVGRLFDDNKREVSGEEVQVFIDANYIGTTVTDNNGTYRFLVPEKLMDGTYAITIFCIQSEIVLGPYYFTIDTTLPLLSVVDPQENSVINASTVTVSGVTSSKAMVMIYLDNDTYGNICYADATGYWSIDYALSNGLHSVVARASDTAHNVSPTSIPRNFTVNASS